MTENETQNTPASPEPVGDVTDTAAAPEVKVEETAVQEAPASEPVTEAPTESAAEEAAPADQASEPAGEPAAAEPTSEPAGEPAATEEAPAQEAAEPAAEEAAPVEEVSEPAAEQAAEPVVEQAPEAPVEPAAVEPAAAVVPPADPIAGSVVESQPVATPAPVVPEVVAVPASPASLSDVPLLQANDADARTLQGLKEITDAYVAKMGAAIPVNAASGAQHQQGLFRHIESILRLEGTVFTRAWSDLLAKVNAERQGAFHESRVFRFFDQIKLDAEQSKVFQNLLHLMIHTADPKGRQLALKHLDLGSVTTGLTTPGAADKIIGYYSQQ